MSSKTNETQKNAIYEATEQYITDNTDLYPKTGGNVYCISLGELIDNGNLPEELLNVITKEKYNEDTMVKVAIDENGNADYELSEDTKCIVNKTDVLSIEVNPGNKTWSSKKTVTIKYPILDTLSDEESPYCYIINNDENNEVCTSKSTISIDFTSNGSIKAYVKVDNNKAEVKNSDGDLVKEISSVINKIDNTLPTCSFEISGETDRKTVSEDKNSIWYTGDVVTIKTTYSDGEKSESNSGILTKTGLSSKEYNNKAIYNNKMGEEKDSFFKTSYQKTDTNGTDWYCYVKDKAGNETYNKIRIYKDSKSPTCKIEFEGKNNGDEYKNSTSTKNVYYDGKENTENINEQWYTDEVNINLIHNDIGGKDEISGTTTYKLGLEETSLYDESANIDIINQNEDTNSTTYYGLTIDEAGNVSRCSRTIFKDGTNPICELIQEADTQGNGAWWIKGDVKISFNSFADATSGIKSNGISNSKNISYDNKTGTQDIDTAGTMWYGYVLDNAGNKGTCETKVYRDTVNPTCEFTSEGILGNDEWYISKNVTTKISSDDETSKIEKQNMNINNIEDYDVSITFMELKDEDDTNGITYYGFVQDYAGNKGTCNKTIKKDSTAPTCEIDLSGETNNIAVKDTVSSIWYTNNVDVKLKHNDLMSGVKLYGMNNKKSEKYNSVDKMIQKKDTTGQEYFGYVQDKAGNKSECTNKVYKDSVAPKITITINSQNGEYNTENVNYKYTITDNKSGSGIKSYCESWNGECIPTIEVNQPSFTFNSEKNSHYIGEFGSGKSNTIFVCAIDNAGNKKCESSTYTVYKFCNQTNVSYGNWGPCNKSCGEGQSSRDVTYFDKYDDSNTCKTATETESCNTQSCETVYYPCRKDYTCVHSYYGTYSQCGGTVYNDGNGNADAIPTDWCDGYFCHISSGTYEGWYIADNCLTTDPSGICAYWQCPG